MRQTIQKRPKKAATPKKRTPVETRGVNLDIPIWMLKILDHKANSLGISRKAIINVILGQTLTNKKSYRLDLNDNMDLQGLSKMVASEWSSDNDEEAFSDL